MANNRIFSRIKLLFTIPLLITFGYFCGTGIRRITTDRDSDTRNQKCLTMIHRHKNTVIPVYRGIS